MREIALGRQRGRKRKNDSDEIAEDNAAERAPRDPLHSDGISSSELERIEKSESRQIQQLELERSRVKLQEKNGANGKHENGPVGTYIFHG
jgi:hypothetical protein